MAGMPWHRRYGKGARLRRLRQGRGDIAGQDQLIWNPERKVKQDADRLIFQVISSEKDPQACSGVDFIAYQAA